MKRTPPQITDDEAFVFRDVETALKQAHKRANEQNTVYVVSCFRLGCIYTVTVFLRGMIKAQYMRKGAYYAIIAPSSEPQVEIDLRVPYIPKVYSRNRFSRTLIAIAAKGA